LPAAISAKAVVKAIRERSGIEIGAGQGKCADSMLRIGHMGWCDEESLRLTLDELGAVLREQGFEAKSEPAEVTNPV
jgi:aspartate aminotransferase-like enzyme